MIDAQPKTLAGIRNKAMLSLGYDFLARRSELVALRTSDLEFTKDGALKGMIRKSKTDQYVQGRLVFGSERSAKLLRVWFRKKPKEIEAVWCAINHGQCLDRSICDRNVNEIIKKNVVKVKRYKRSSDLEFRDTPYALVPLRTYSSKDMIWQRLCVPVAGQMRKQFRGICDSRSIIFGSEKSKICKHQFLSLSSLIVQEFR
jgi:integrase